METTQEFSSIRRASRPPSGQNLTDTDSRLVNLTSSSMSQPSTQDTFLVRQELLQEMITRAVDITNQQLTTLDSQGEATANRRRVAAEVATSAEPLVDASDCLNRMTTRDCGISEGAVRQVLAEYQARQEVLAANDMITTNLNLPASATAEEIRAARELQIKIDKALKTLENNSQNFRLTPEAFVDRSISELEVTKAESRVPMKNFLSLASLGLAIIGGFPLAFKLTIFLAMEDMLLGLLSGVFISLLPPIAVLSWQCINDSNYYSKFAEKIAENNINPNIKKFIDRAKELGFLTKVQYQSGNFNIKVVK